MFTTILLLDCSDALKVRLEGLGYDVKTGTSGYITGMRTLPCPVYECDLIVYNPTCQPTKVTISAKEGPPTDTPVLDFSRDTLAKHALGGGHWLVFVNKLSEIEDIQQFAYSFVPGLPRPYFTQDSRFTLSKQLRDEKYMEKYLPLFRSPKSLKITTPIRIKLPGDKWENFTPFLVNARGEELAGRTWGNSGTVTCLPTFDNNEEAVLVYLDHVFPKLSNSASRQGIEEFFLSPRELALVDEEVKITKEFTALEGGFHDTKREMAVERKAKLDKIRADETATRLLEFYRVAQEDPTDPWVPLFKIVETISHKFGGEAEGKAALVVCNAEWNLLKRLSNESERNTRHAVRPGEMERPVTNDEIRQSFEAAKKMTCAYFWTLFNPGKPT